MAFDGDAAVLLLTMRCNIRCDHCSVDSHPERTEELPLQRALDLVDELCAAPWLTFIDVTGGETLLRRRDLLDIARRVKSHGKSVRVVSNGYWARSERKAVEVLRELIDAGVSSVGLSIDEWHLDHLPSDCVHHYIAAARTVGLIPLLSCVVRSPPQGAGDRAQDLLALLERYGVDRRVCLEMDRWSGIRSEMDVDARSDFDRDVAATRILVGWQLLTGEGRAAHLDLGSLEENLETAVPTPCAAAGDLPTFDEEGRLFPCCAPWCSRKQHAFERRAGEAADAAVVRMRSDPVVRVIHDRGPLVLIRKLEKRGVSFPKTHSGICNQCGMLLDRAPPDLLRDAAQDVLGDRPRAEEAGPRPASEGEPMRTVPLDMLMWKQSPVPLLHRYVGALVQAAERLTDSSDSREAEDLRAVIERSGRAAFHRVLVAPVVSSSLMASTPRIGTRDLALFVRMEVPELWGDSLPSGSWSASGSRVLTEDRFRDEGWFRRWTLGRRVVSEAPAAWPGGPPVDIASPFALYGDPGMGDFEHLAYPLPADEAFGALRNVNEAFATVADRHEGCAEFVECWTRVVALRSSRDCDLSSSSVSDVPGRTILINAHRSEPERLCEALVHEAIHAFLSFIELSAPFMSVQGGTALVRSPWSGRELPPHAFVHACFVWFGLLHFWRHVAGREPSNGWARDRAEFCFRGFEGLGEGAGSPGLGDCVRADVLEQIRDMRRMALSEPVA